MADRLSKLCESLNNENYDLAIQLHKSANQSLSQLDEASLLKLAKAYFLLANDYPMVI